MLETVKNKQEIPNWKLKKGLIKVGKVWGKNVSKDIFTNSVTVKRLHETVPEI